MLLLAHTAYHRCNSQPPAQASHHDRLHVLGSATCSSAARLVTSLRAADRTAGLVACTWTGREAGLSTRPAKACIFLVVQVDGWGEVEK